MWDINRGSAEKVLNCYEEIRWVYPFTPNQPNEILWAGTQSTGTMSIEDYSVRAAWFTSTPFTSPTIAEELSTTDQPPRIVVFQHGHATVLNLEEVRDGLWNGSSLPERK